MSHPSETEIQLLSDVAADLKEVFSERGYRIDVAMEVDAGFGSGASRSWLARDLAVDAIGASASRRGLDFRPVNGIGREFRWFEDGIDRRYRLRKAMRGADGSYVIKSNSAAALAASEDSLFEEDVWVLGYTVSDEYLVDAVFIAPVLGYEEGSPGQLILGRAIELVTPQPTNRGFQPADEDLDGFDDAGSGDAQGLL